MKKLLIDSFGTDIKFKLEEDKSGNFIARGEFGRCDVPTENNRVYPRSIWEREIKKIKEPMQAGKVLGHLDHPTDGKTSLNLVSHVMRNIWIEPDGRIIGEAAICDNEHGRKLKSILAAGGIVGVSSRGMGSTKMNEDGYDVVQDDYSYMVHDFVADPAVKSSYPEFSQSSKSREVKEEKSHEIPKSVNEGEGDMDKKIEEALKSQKEQLTEKFSKELVAKLKEQKDSLKKEALEEVKNELLSDPSVAGARTSLDKVKEILTPFLLPEDTNKIIEDKNREISLLKESLDTKDKEISECNSRLGKAVVVARKLGMALTLEKSLAESSDRESILKSVGELNQYENQAALDEAVSRAKDEIKMRLVESSRRKKRLEMVSKKFEEKIKKQDEQIDKLQKSLEESISLSKSYALRLYASNKLRGNPNKEKAMKLIESASTKDEADKIIAEFSIEEGDKQQYNLIRDRMNLQKLKARNNLVEDQVKNTQKSSSDELMEDGIDAELASVMNLNEAKALANI